MTTCSRTAIACALLLGVSPSVGQAEGDTKTPLAISYEKYTLDNGLEVILHEDHRLPVVAVNIWYHVGAFHEPQGRTGFAHLFEHMMFQGSAHVGDDVHIKMLEQIGASDLNGTTGFDRTNYFETVPSNHLETALWLESDRMGFFMPALSQEKLDNQRSVVQNERRQSTETQPYGLAQERMWQALFPKPHPYFGDVIGSMADLDAASVDDVKGFFKTWYAPSNATLAVVGDFDTAAAKGLIEKYFGSLSKAPKPTPPAVTPVVVDEEIALEHAEQVATLAKVMLGWHSPAFFAPGDATADVLATVLTGGKASLLHKRLVRELEIAQSVSAWQQSHGSQSVFRIDATARPGTEPKLLLAEIDKVLQAVRDGAVTAEEVQRAQNRYETGFFRDLQRVGGFGGKANLLQRYNHFKGEPGFLANDVERYRAVTHEAVQQFAAATLTDKRVVMLAVPPTKTAAAAADREGK